MTMTWEPKTWTDTRYPAPYIPVLDGKTLQQYADALQADGTGHGDTVTTIYDPATSAVGAVTKWQWNLCIHSYLRTATGELEYRAHPSAWMWDVVSEVRHVMAWHAFRLAHREGRLVGYWDTAPNREVADAAHQARWGGAQSAAHRNS
jgi:hypothetical protein